MILRSSRRLISITPAIPNASRLQHGNLAHFAILKSPTARPSSTLTSSLASPSPDLLRRSILPLHVFNADSELSLPPRRDRIGTAHDLGEWAERLPTSPRAQLGLLRKLLRTRGDPVLCWTVFREAAERERRELREWRDNLRAELGLEPTPGASTASDSEPVDSKKSIYSMEVQTDDGIAGSVSYQLVGQSLEPHSTTLPTVDRMTPDDRTAAMTLLLQHPEPEEAAAQVRRAFYHPTFGYQTDANGARLIEHPDRRDVWIWLAILSRAGYAANLRTEYAIYFEGPDGVDVPGRDGAAEARFGRAKWRPDLAAAKMVFAGLADRFAAKRENAVRGEPIPKQRVKLNRRFDDPLAFWAWMCGEPESIVSESESTGASDMRQKLWRETDPEVWSLLIEHLAVRDRVLADRTWTFLRRPDAKAAWKQTIIADPRPWDASIPLFLPARGTSDASIDAAVSFLESMSRTVAPSETTFDALLRALCTLSDPKPAEWAWTQLILRETSDGPPTPFHSSFEAILAMYLRLLYNPKLADNVAAELSEHAWEVWTHAEQLRVKPSWKMADLAFAIARRAGRMRGGGVWGERLADVEGVREGLGMPRRGLDSHGDKEARY